MSKTKFSLFIPFLLGGFLLFIQSCSQPPSPVPTLSDTHKKFIDICKNDYALDVVLKPLKNTVWIYIPKEESFIDIRAGENGPQNSNEAKEALTIKFIDGKFKDSLFFLEYDIGPIKNYPKDYGYATTYTGSYQKDHRNILTAIYRAFSALEIQENKKISPEKVPDFFVVVTADIKRGVKIQTTLCFQDLLRAMTDPYFMEEYSKRVMVDLPAGDKKIIGDQEGKNLKIEELTWPEFLIRQIIYRIQFKYQRSAFAPSEDTRKEILAAAAETLATYNFQDYHFLQLHNLSQNAYETLKKDELADYLPKEPKTEGKIHVIEFLK